MGRWGKSRRLKLKTKFVQERQEYQRRIYSYFPVALTIVIAVSIQIKVRDLWKLTWHISSPHMMLTYSPSAYHFSTYKYCITYFYIPYIFYTPEHYRLVNFNIIYISYNLFSTNHFKIILLIWFVHFSL